MLFDFINDQLATKNKQTGVVRHKQFKIIVPKFKKGQIVNDGAQDFTLIQGEKYNRKELTLDKATIHILNGDISKNVNLISCYDELVSKISRQLPIFSSYVTLLEDKRVLFNQLFNNDNSEQIKVLQLILRGIHANNDSQNISQLKISRFGRLQTITTLNGDAKLIFQSITGLFRREVCLDNL